MNEEQRSELIEATTARIVATKVEGEPFSSIEGFWAAGFHRMSFKYLEDIISTIFLNSLTHEWFDDCSEKGDETKRPPYPTELANEMMSIQRSFSDFDNLETCAKKYVQDMEWVGRPPLRKEVLRRLHKVSFPLLGPRVHNENTVLEQYVTPPWLSW